MANVNDAPVGAGNTVATLQDTAYVFAASDFGFADPNDTPANNLLAVRISTLPLVGSLTNNGAPVFAGQYVSVADINSGLLVFTPISGTNGASSAAVTFQVQDDGGGADLDTTPRTITVDVNLPGAIPAAIIDPVLVIAEQTTFVSPPPVIAPDTKLSSSAKDSEPDTASAESVDDDATAEIADAGHGDQILPAPQVQTNVNRLAAGLPGLPHGTTQSRYGSEFVQPSWVEINQIMLTATDFSLAAWQQSGIGISASPGDGNFEEHGEEFWTIDTGVHLTGLMISAGFVTWAVRGAGLLTSLLAITPAWHNLDPLPVLGGDQDEEKKDWAVDEDHEASQDEFAVSDLWTFGDHPEAAWDEAKSLRLFALDQGAPDRSLGGSQDPVRNLRHVPG
ncbi:MAG: hypothetical protein ACREO9_08740, partial [Lysobacterales bacterium]